jgi:Pectate lyase superfamily protein
VTISGSGAFTGSGVLTPNAPPVVLDTIAFSNVPTPGDNSPASGQTFSGVTVNASTGSGALFATGTNGHAFVFTATAKLPNGSTDTAARFTAAITNTNGNTSDSTSVASLGIVDNLNGTATVTITAAGTYHTGFVVASITATGVTRNYRLGVCSAWTSTGAGAVSFLGGTQQLVWLPQPPPPLDPPLNPVNIVASNLFNVVTYGADVTGGTDSAAAFRSAIAAAITNGPTSVVWIPAGNYLMSSQDPNKTTANAAIQSGAFTVAGAGRDQVFLLNTGRGGLQNLSSGMTLRDYTTDAATDESGTQGTYANGGGLATNFFQTDSCGWASSSANGCLLKGCGVLGGLGFSMRCVGNGGQGSIQYVGSPSYTVPIPSSAPYGANNTCDDFYMDGGSQSASRSGQGNQTADFDIDYQQNFTITRVLHFGGVSAHYEFCGFTVNGWTYVPTARAQVNDGWHVTRPGLTVTGSGPNLPNSWQNMTGWGSGGIWATGASSASSVQSKPLLSCTISHITVNPVTNANLVNTNSTNFGDAGLDTDFWTSTLTGYTSIDHCSFYNVFVNTRYTVIGTWNAATITITGTANASTGGGSVAKFTGWTYG